VSKLDHTLEPEAPSVRRLEIITGTGRRRQFSDDDKARIVEETLAPGAVVSEVARRHGLTPQQVFTWRRQARRPRLAGGDKEAPVPTFVPAVVDPAPLPAPLPKYRVRRQGRKADDLAGMIEVAIAGVTVRVGRGADTKMLAAVITALKATT
jgi:transposase